MTETAKNNNPTRMRILEKAEDLFAQRGYHGVSIREITAAAKCNMAAVNYHFTNKKNLYMEVFRQRWIPQEKRMYEQFLASLPDKSDLTPTKIISALAQSYLKGPLTDEELRRHRQLIVREMNYPTEAFEEVAEKTLRPLFETLYELLKPFKKNNKDGALTFDIMSIFGMVLYLNYSRPMVSQIVKKNYDDAFKALLIDHLVSFSLNGLGA
jgi:AcrR family transcriptional regulator